MGTVTLTGCTFRGNTAGRIGGGLFDSSGTLTMTGCTVDGNSASSGGGLNLSRTLFSRGIGKATLTGCTIDGNSAGRWGRP